MRNKIVFLPPFLVILILACWPTGYAQGYDENSRGQESSYRHGYPAAETTDYVENGPGEEFPYRTYITPEDRAVQALAERINGVEEAYKAAVQWTYISEQALNHAADKWLTPHEFLTSTPYYPSNPLPGEAVSDCEEQANTLVSLIRAEGTSPEEVRVALGTVIFNDIKIGHAWVELLIERDWVALDPSFGPYWDDKAGKLVRRQGVPFDHYASHTYPVCQAWAYYNDVYLLSLIEYPGDAPASWFAMAQTR